MQEKVMMESTNTEEEENDSLLSMLLTTFDINLSQRIKWKKQNFTNKCTSCLSLDIEAINDCEEIIYYIWEKGEKIMTKFFEVW